MFKIIKTAALSALIGLGGISAMPASAMADGFYLGFGGGHGPRVGVYLGDEGRHYRGPRRARACTPGQAVRKAHRLGIRHARVVRANRNIIRVRGSGRGYNRVAVFARAPHCPVIRVR